jgi:hypothetical protein
MGREVFTLKELVKAGGMFFEIGKAMLYAVIRRGGEIHHARPLWAEETSFQNLVADALLDQAVILPRSEFEEIRKLSLDDERRTSILRAISEEPGAEALFLVALSCTDFQVQQAAVLGLARQERNSLLRDLALSLKQGRLAALAAGLISNFEDAQAVQEQCCSYPEVRRAAEAAEAACSPNTIQNPKGREFSAFVDGQMQYEQDGSNYTGWMGKIRVSETQVRVWFSFILVRVAGGWERADKQPTEHGTGPASMKFSLSDFHVIDIGPGSKGSNRLRLLRKRTGEDEMTLIPADGDLLPSLSLNDSSGV